MARGVTPSQCAAIAFVVLVVLSLLRPSRHGRPVRTSSAAPRLVPAEELQAWPMPPPPPLPGFRVVEAGEDDPFAGSEYLRRRPHVRHAMRRAIRAALRDADRNASADPYELLAQRLLDGRGGAARAAARDAAAVGARGGGDVWAPPPPPPPPGGDDDLVATAPKRASRHALPPKLPTLGMWPPLRKSAATPYSSLGQLSPYRGGDLEAPGELAKATAARAWKGELILTYGNEAGTAWIANLVFSLRAVGIEHFLVVVMSDEHCRALMRPPWMISCAWSSWDFGGCKNKMEMRRLWYSRHHYMSRVIEETGLNVAVVDGDMSVRSDFYPLLKAPPLQAHNLIYTLDHAPTCGDLNVGFAYCQGCAPKGPAQWAIDEGLRRENYFCGGADAEFGDGGAFWRASDAAGASKGPHRWAEWGSARDQKVYSDVVGGACCGAPQYRLMFPSSHKVVDNYAFMRQWGQHAKCRTMAPQRANDLQTWWHALLSGRRPNATTHDETVAIATGRLASGWHGTGEGELAGWSGRWVATPPAIAHFVGAAPAGGKVDIMQGLGWWRYEADVVAHAVQEETGKVAGMALPRSYFSAKTQRGLLALAGPAAVLRADKKEDFVQQFVALRFWLLAVATLLQRTAVDPAPHCESSWVPTDRQTGHRGHGYRGKWYTPGWPWPFQGGVGIVVGNCSVVGGATAPSVRAGQPSHECCSAIFGKMKEGVKCIETAHRAVLEQALAVPGVARGAATLNLDELIVDGAIDASRLRAAADRHAAQVLWVRPPSAVERLPPLKGLTAEERAAIGEFVRENAKGGPHDECAVGTRRAMLQRHLPQ